MKSKRQRQEEALERTEERVKFWEGIVNGKTLSPDQVSLRDMQYVEGRMMFGLLSQKATTSITLSMAQVDLARVKIKSLTRDINNLKKKLEY